MVTFSDVYWLLETIYIYLPAYTANAAPVILGGGPPLDGGRNWIDGKPLFGDHKTIRGTLAGVSVGIITGLLQRDFMKGFLLSVGAIGGDIFFSFVKRRLKLKPGAMFPIADQMGFIVSAVLLLALVQPSPTWERMMAIIVATLPIHYLTNVLAWIFKLKSNPW
jgi:CDP-2,3-bis-(O-geranylgeranyl)-sn-glycerol synthase